MPSSYISYGSKPKGRISFLRGAKAGIPVALGYIPVAITFGLLAETSEIPLSVTLLMSLLVYAGASQFVGVNLMAAGTAGLEIIFTTFILNLRHFFMGASLSQKLPRNMTARWTALAAFGITDETFSVASMQEEKELPPAFLIGLNLVAFSAWNVGTWIGVFLSVGLPPSVQSSMGIALYAMFIGLLIPSLKKARPIVYVTAIAIIIHCILNWIVPMFMALSA